MKHKILSGGTAVTSILATIAYGVAHIGGAIILFKSVKLWLFIVILLVPGIGDIAGVISLIKTGNWWPLVSYVAAIALWMISAALASAADKQDA